MGDFATEIICGQENSVLYPVFGLSVQKKSSFDSSFSTCDSCSEQWLTPKVQSPVEGLYLTNNDFKWCEVRLDGKSLFNEKVDLENSLETEYKYYTPRRVSSLKTSRTPPGTPKSKAVRFADALGLDLEDVRHIFNRDLPPKIPASAIQDLVLDSEPKADEENPLKLVANFVQPGAASDFLRRVKMHNVALESALVDNNVLSGTIRVMNITFDKKVTVRVSFDEWINHVDLEANYVADSNDGVTDRFSFSFSLPFSSQTYGHRIQLAICYQCSNGAQHWDNNFGQNYVYSCVCNSQNSVSYH